MDRARSAGKERRRMGGGGDTIRARRVRRARAATPSLPSCLADPGRAELGLTQALAHQRCSVYLERAGGREERGPEERAEGG